jgi:hypothetical protein
MDLRKEKAGYWDQSTAGMGTVVGKKRKRDRPETASRIQPAEKRRSSRGVQRKEGGSET